MRSREPHPCEAGEGKAAEIGCRVRSRAWAPRPRPCPIFCPVAAIAGALGWPTARRAPGDDPARGRRLSFSCPAASRVAQLSAGLAAGIPAFLRARSILGSSSYRRRFTCATTFCCPFLFPHLNMSLPTGKRRQGLAMHVVLISCNNWRKGTGLFCSDQFHLYCAVSGEH